MVETIEFKGEIYPKFQSDGFASKFAFPFAKEVCKGKGYDIGCNRLEWCFPGAIPIDPLITEGHALELPEDEVDFIFSSHALEHCNYWVDILDYWHETLKEGGVLFLYLPDFSSQKYWRPWFNRKHLNAFTPEIIRTYFEDKGFKNIFCSGIDLNNSFMIFGEK